MSVIVYKLGGSLLDLPDLPQRLQRIVPPDASALFVVGGGAAADLVREWDRLHRLGEERAHWLALRSLALNEALLIELLPGATLVASRDEAAAAWQRKGWAILSAYDFIRAEEPAAPLPLPHSWDATSDSIAAWVAALWPADRLVLLKSVGWPASGGADCGLRIADCGLRSSELPDATSEVRNRKSETGSPATVGHPQSAIGAPATVGHPQSLPVDPYFHKLAPALSSVEWVNLRDDDPCPLRLTFEPRRSPRETAVPPTR